MSYEQEILLALQTIIKQLNSTKKRKIFRRKKSRTDAPPVMEAFVFDSVKRW